METATVINYTIGAVVAQGGTIGTVSIATPPATSSRTGGKFTEALLLERETSRNLFYITDRNQTKGKYATFLN